MKLLSIAAIATLLGTSALADNMAVPLGFPRDFKDW